MRKLTTVTVCLTLPLLGSCAGPTPWTPSTFRQMDPVGERFAPRAVAIQEPDEANGDGPTIHVGLGSAYSPSTPVLGASMDFHIDDNLTFGPAVQLGGDDNSMIFAGFGQLRYWLGNESDKNRILPYLQAGLGLAHIDRDNRGNGTDYIVNFGGGVRLLTGDGYRIGSNVLFNSVPGEIAGDKSYITWEIVQVSFDL